MYVKKIWITQGQWRTGLLKGVILEDRINKLLIAFTWEQYQQYTCACQCSLRVHCPKGGRNKKFKRGVCVEGSGPVRDSLITGRVS